MWNISPAILLGRAYANTTAEVVKDLVTKEIGHVFGPPETIVSENAACFTAKSIVYYMQNNGIRWRTGFGLRSDVEREGRANVWNMKEKNKKEGSVSGS